MCERDCAAMTLTHKEVCVLNPQIRFYVNTAAALVVAQQFFLLTVEDWKLLILFHLIFEER